MIRFTYLIIGQKGGHMLSRTSRLAVFFTIIAVFLITNCGISLAKLTSKDLPDRDGVKFGKAIVHAALRTEEVFDSNIFLDNTDRKSDFITVLSPSVGIEVPLRENNLSVDYETSIFFYGRFDTENHIDHRVRGQAEINLTDYKVNIDDVFRIFTNRASNENSLRLKQEVNDFRAGVKAEFERLGFDVGYTNLIEAYSSNDTFFGSLTYNDKNRVSNIIDMTASYRFLPKTLFLLENDLGFIHYYNSSLPPGSYYDEALVGIKGEWFSRSNVNLKAGFRYQNYDESSIIADKAYAGPVIRGGFDYSPSDNDVVIVNLEKTVYESTYSNMNYYDANLAAVKYRHQFTDKVSSTLSGSYQLHLYPSQTTENGQTAKRSDNYLGGSASLRYDIRKWMSLEAKYDYKQRISKFDIFDFIDHSVAIRGTIGF